MADELYRDAFGAITLDADRGLLRLDWFEGSGAMTDDDFKDFLSRFAELGEAHRPTAMVVDGREFRHSFTPELSQWRDETIIPRYNEAGLEKMAFLLPEEVLPDSEPAPEGDADYPTGYFADEEALNEWLEA